jgi:hypothetical protein
MKKLIAAGILFGTMVWMALPAAANTWTCMWISRDFYVCHDQYGHRVTCVVFAGGITNCRDN